MVAYRAGYLASDRRLIERGLADGTVRGVAATNALELGVDIAGLDTVVLCGLPGQSSRLLAAGGTGRTAWRRGRGGDDRPTAPAGRVPARSSGRTLRPAGRDDRAGSCEPSGAGAAAGGGRPGAAAAARRRALVRGRHLGAGRAADRARAAASATRRLVLDRSPASGRPDQPAEHRRAPDRHRRGAHRARAGHGRAGRRRPGGAPRSGLPAPGRELPVRRRRLGRRGRRGHRPGGAARLPDPAGGRRRGLSRSPSSGSDDSGTAGWRTDPRG